MEQLTPIEQTTTVAEEPVKKRVALILVALSFLVFCYLFTNLVPIYFYALGYLIFCVALFSVTLVLALIMGARVNAQAVIAVVIGLSAGVFYFLNGGSEHGYYPAFVLTVMSFCFFVLALFGNNNRRWFGAAFLLDCIKATFVYPFISLGSIFTTLFSRRSHSKKAGRAILMTLLGIAIALVLVVVVVSLLSFDENFEKMFTFDLELPDLSEIILRTIICVPLAMLLFSVLYSSMNNKLKGMTSDETVERMGNGVRRIPPVILIIPSAAVLVIYAFFFASQWTYYMSAFSGVLPEAYSAAAYAREGFFQLCIVAGINAMLCILISVFMRAKGQADGLIKKVMTVLISVSTLLLIATALSKMFLYIQRFDLTVARLFASLILLIFALGFVAAILSQFVKKLRVTPVLVAAILLILLVTPFLNVQGRIAKYNVNAFIERADSKDPREIDIDYLVCPYGDKRDGLGTAAIPAAVRLYESNKLDADEQQRLYQSLEKIHDSLKEDKDSAFRISLPDLEAKKLLDELCD